MLSKRNKILSIFYFIIGLIIFLPSVSYAKCSGPSGAAGAKDFQYSSSGSTENFCDDSDTWKNLREVDDTGAGIRQLIQFADDLGACTAAKEGRLRYNSAGSWDYCDSTTWQAFGGGGSLTPATIISSKHSGGVNACPDTNNTSCSWDYSTGTNAAFLDDDVTGSGGVDSRHDLCAHELSSRSLIITATPDFLSGSHDILTSDDGLEWTEIVTADTGSSGKKITLGTVGKYVGMRGNAVNATCHELDVVAYKWPTGGGGGGGSSLWSQGASDDIYYNSGTPMVGIGTTNPTATLDVVGDIDYTGTLTDVSDRRLKENIVPLSNSLEGIMALQGYSFTMKGDVNDAIEYGLMAQDVEPVFPELVKTKASGMMTLNYMGLFAPLVEATKEQQATINAQQKRIDALSTKNADLELRVKAIEDRYGTGIAFP